MEFFVKLTNLETWTVLPTDKNILVSVLSVGYSPSGGPVVKVRSMKHDMSENIYWSSPGMINLSI